MKDYQSIFIKWTSYFESDNQTHKEIYDSLHEEVKKGFEVITKIIVEEIEVKFKNKELFNKIKSLLGVQIAFSLMSGYMLYLISSAKDPEKEKLKEKETTNKLGEEWIASYEKDLTKELMSSIDTFLSLILEKGKQTRINRLFLAFPELMNSSYKEVSEIDKFMVLSAQQGFILGTLEDKLNQKQ